MKFLLGTKKEMTRIFTEDGRAVPVTAIAAGPCVITAVKTDEKHGYTAVQIGYGQKKRLNKAEQGQLKNLPSVRVRREFRIQDVTDLPTGATITVSTFVAGDKVKVQGTSKGKGFQGVVKRHGFHGSPASHGHKDQLRMPGSIGATDAARVFKGMRMGGQMGNASVTVPNLEVVAVDEQAGMIYLKGAIPGARGSLVSLVAEGDLVISPDTTDEPQATESQETQQTAEENSQSEKEAATEQESTEAVAEKEATAEESKAAVEDKKEAKDTDNQNTEEAQVEADKEHDKKA